MFLVAGGTCRPGPSLAFIRSLAGGTRASFPLRPGETFIPRCVGSTFPLFASAAAPVVACAESPARPFVELTKRPSFRSNMIVEPAPLAAFLPVAPLVLATIERDTRVGADADAS